MDAPPDNTESLQTLLPLDAQRLCWRCDPGQLDFDTSDGLADLTEILGQARALEAVEFGIGMGRNSYHLFAQGPSGIGKRTVVRQFLERRAAGEPTPPDWCYVNNFGDPQKPLALRLPPGRGAQLKQQMETLLDDLRTAIPGALQTDEHRGRLQEIEREFEAQHARAFEELAAKAETQGIKLLRTPGGFALAPIRNGEVLGPEQFAKLPDEEKRQVEQTVGALAELERTLQAKADEASRALAAAASQVGVQWSFQVARGQVVPATLDAAAGVDFLILGLEGPVPRATTRGSSSARYGNGRPTLVVYDGSPAGGRALDAAARLARDHGAGLVVLLVMTDLDAAKALRAQAARRLREIGIASSLEEPPLAAAAELLAVARRRQAKTLVLNLDSPLLDEESLEILVNRLHCPVILVR